MKKLKYILIGIICLLGIILIANLYLYWKATVNDNHGYNSINALIALIALLVNIVTIIFLYINYRQVKDQNHKNNQDSEFNRILDLIFRSEELVKRNISKIKLKSNVNINGKLKGVFTFDELSTFLDSQHISYGKPNSSVLKSELRELFVITVGRFKTYVNNFENVLKIYNTSVYNNQLLSINNKNLLKTIIGDLFYNDEINRITRYKDKLISHYDNLKSELFEYYENNKSREETNDGKSHIIVEEAVKDFGFTFSKLIEKVELLETKNDITN